MTALETALGKVLTGAGKAMGWATGLETAGLGLLEGAGVVVPMGGVLTVGLEIVGLGLERAVLVSCGCGLWGGWGGLWGRAIAWRCGRRGLR